MATLEKVIKDLGKTYANFLRNNSRKCLWNQHHKAS